MSASLTAFQEEVRRAILAAEEHHRLLELLETLSKAKPTARHYRPTRYTLRIQRRLIRLLVNRILRMLLHRACNGVAKLGASERHGASASFMCQYLYPTPRSELA
jgi:hypothetical protein